MSYRVWVDRDVVASFEDEPAALAFVGEHFAADLIRDDVWLEFGDDDNRQLVHGEQLVKRVRAVYPVDRLSA